MTKRKLPTSIRILGQRWRIQYVPDLRDENGTKLDGLTSPATRTISLCATGHATQALMASTLVHEILHVILRVSGLNELMSEQMEEAMVRALEHGLEDLVTLRGFE